MAKSNVDGFGRTNMGLEPMKLDPQVSEDIIQSLCRDMGFDYQNHEWRALATDLDGRLIISMSGVAINQAIGAAVNMNVAAAILLAANPNRRQVLIYNNGGLTFYLGFNNGVLAANGMPMPAGASYIDNIYTGEYWGISPGGACNVRYMEF